MKTLLSISLLAALAGVASATGFTTVAFVPGDGTGTAPNLGQSFTTLNNTYTATFTNFNLVSPSYIDVQWTHSFDTTVATANSPATNPYGSVTQTVSGTVTRTSGTDPVSFSAILSETVTNSLGVTFGTGSQPFNFSTTPTTSATVPFTLTLTVPFSSPLASGFAIKDDLFFNASTNSRVTVNSIAQSYSPVPEPTTIAGLAIGGLALLRRRKR